MRFPKAMFTDVTLVLVTATLLVIPALAQQNGSGRVGLPQDWSHHYVIFTNTAAPDIVAHPEIAKQLQNDPRFLAYVINSNARRQIALLPHDPPGATSRIEKNKLKRDWSIPLGSGTTNLNQFPAKYTTNVNLAPDCVHDFVVYPVNVAGSSTQPNIVGFNYLYSGGTTLGAGLCNPLTPASPGASASPDAGTLSDYSAAVYFSYNVSAIGGAVLTSPVISLDGSKVAFVESAPSSGTVPHFHVLAFNPGDGVNMSQPIDVETPVQITTDCTALVTVDCFQTTTQPAASQATDLPYGTCTTTTNGNSNSAPFVDYANDVAYVGDDCGYITRIKNVFCPNGICNVAPTVDTTYGTAGSIKVCSGFVATSPVLDTTSGDVFMGCSDGNMYKVASGVTPKAQNGGGTGAISDPPLVDSNSAWVYWTNASNGTGAMLAQASTLSFLTPSTVTFGQPGVGPVHAGTFNDPYFDDPGAPATWAVFLCGFSTTSPYPPELFDISFTGGGILNTVAASTTLGMPGTGGWQCSPITEFLGGDGTDRIFLGVNSGSVNMYPVGTSSTDTFPTTVTTAAENGGTSGIVVDNNSSAANASSFYFATLAVALSDGKYHAVKLTDSTLQ